MVGLYLNPPENAIVLAMDEKSQITAIDAYLAANNTNPTPFVWSQAAEEVLEKVRRGRIALNAPTQSPTKTETVH